ncbi:glycosyltransferase family 2 protein [Geotalea toluenoxydans]
MTTTKITLPTSNHPPFIPDDSLGVFCLDASYATTRLVTREMPVVEDSPDATFKSALYLSPNPERKGEGGLRTQGYFKRSFPDRPLITVITVVFNGEKCLEETIRSVINQTYDNVEYIIIDGASTDGTIDIVKQYDGQIDYWLSEKDEGIYDAMNKGINKATGEWVNFMNSGDSFYGNNVVELIFNKQIIASVIYGNTLYQYDSVYKKIRKAEKLTFKYGLPFCHQSSFTKTEILKAEMFCRLYKIFADFDLFAKLKKNGSIFVYADLTVSIFNCDGVSTVKSTEHLKELYAINKKYNVFYAAFLVLDIIFRETMKRILPKKFVRQIQVSK